MTTATEKELLRLLKIKADAGEDRQDFLTRVVQEAAASISDDDWRKLTKPAQRWVNKATKAYKAEKELPEFTADAPPKEDAKPDKPAKAPKATKAAKAAEADDEDEDAKPAKGKRAKADKAANGAAPLGGTSAMMFIREFLAENPATTVDDIQAALASAGMRALSKVAINTTRSEFRSFSRIFQQKGFFKSHVTLGKF